MDDVDTQSKPNGQLVLQFKPWADRGIDDLVALEDALLLVLGDEAVVDGHDAGSDEANIFIRTRDPLATLKKCWGRSGPPGSSRACL